jgi:hypothetical protein
MKNNKDITPDEYFALGDGLINLKPIEQDDNNEGFISEVSNEQF